MHPGSDCCSRTWASFALSVQQPSPVPRAPPACKRARRRTPRIPASQHILVQGMRLLGKLAREIARIQLVLHIPGKIDKSVAHLELRDMTLVPEKPQWLTKYIFSKGEILEVEMPDESPVEPLWFASTGTDPYPDLRIRFVQRAEPLASSKPPACNLALRLSLRCSRLLFCLPYKIFDKSYTCP